MSSAQASSPIIGGTLLVDFGSQILNLSIPFAGGTGSVPVSVPNSPSLVGFTGYFQSAAPDGTPPFGWALTNGLQVVVCP